MPTHPTTLAGPRWLVAALVVLGLAVVGVAESADPAAATTPLQVVDGTEPTTATTPTTPPPPDLGLGATAARVSWSAPAAITEEQRFSLGVSGEINGQATVHAALLRDVAVCPASPLYPRQIASGTRVGVAAVPAPASAPASATPTAADTATAAPLGGTVSHSVNLTSGSSGGARLCGWLVAFPASSEASTVARFDQPVGVANKSATLMADIPAGSRAGDYFTVKIAGSTPGSGRRVLIMAEPDKGQSCDALRKAASGKRPLQSVTGLPSGEFSKTLRLRYRSKTAGPHLLCAQIVEASDRNPEASASRVMSVSEGLKCVATQTALAQRGEDLTVIRRRRDAAQTRLKTARTKVAPARAKVSRQRKASERRIATARKALRRAKSKDGKRKASRRLAAVKRREEARIYRAGAPLRKANAAVRMHQRSYTQYRTGARLLDETIARTKKDLKKYCARA